MADLISADELWSSVRGKLNTLAAASARQGWSPISTINGNMVGGATRKTAGSAYGSSGINLFGVTYQSVEISPVSVPAVRVAIGNIVGSVSVSAGSAIGETAVYGEVEVRVALVDFATGFVVPARFGGAPSVLIGQQGIVFTDPVEFPVTAGVAYGVRVEVMSSSPETAIPAMSGLGGTIGGATLWSNAGAWPNGNAWDPAATGMPAASGGGMMHLMVLGYTGAPAKSILGLLDSIAQGLGDAGAVNGVGSGWIAAIGRNRTALSDTQAGLVTPYCGVTILAKQGEMASNFATVLGRTERISLAAFHSNVIDEGGINDFIAGTVSVAQLKAAVLAIAKAVTDRGCKYIRATLTPQTSSTDGWVTAANQTPLSTNTNRLAFNDWLRDTGATGFIQQAIANGSPARLLAVIDPCAWFEVDASNVPSLSGGRWKAPTSAAVYTGAVTTGGSTSQLTDTSIVAAANAYRGGVIVVTSGPNAGKSSGITAQSAAGVLNFNTAFGSSFTVGNTYQVYTTGGPLTSDGTHWSSPAVVAAQAAFDKSVLI